MIQELKIRNFKSFRDEVELSFEPSEDDRYNSVVTMPDGVKLLRFAVVLGANASGKSNLLDAVELLRRFWNTLPSTNDDGTDVQPFLLREDALSFDTEFELKFYADGLRYWYKLKVNPEKVCHESLFVYLSNRPTKVFCREDVLRNEVVRVGCGEQRAVVGVGYGVGHRQLEEVERLAVGIGHRGELGGVNSGAVENRVARGEARQGVDVAVGVVAGQRLAVEPEDFARVEAAQQLRFDVGARHRLVAVGGEQAAGGRQNGSVAVGLD